jgi:hypothetical protein
VPIAPLLIVGDRKLHDFDEPPEPMGELHDRMPVILAENDWPKWLGEEAAGANEVGCRILRDLLKNFRACLNAAATAMAGYF